MIKMEEKVEIIVFQLSIHQMEAQIIFSLNNKEKNKNKNNLTFKTI